MKKEINKLLILDVNPYGVLTDTVKWIEYLRRDWKITLVSFRSDSSEKKRPSDVKFIELPNSKNRNVKGILFLLVCILILLFYRGKVLVVYFPYCELLKKLFPRKRMLLDIRTLAVNPNAELRRKANDRIREACKWYDAVSVISKGVGVELGLSDFVVLPLGSDVISSKQKDYTQSMNLLYVGTLNNRDIDKTILGVKYFISQRPNVPLQYTIVGFGTQVEEDKIMNMIRDEHLENRVQFVGRVKHSALQQYFDLSNVGVSFVPITPYFNYQPPTKTFEYCLSGLFCIATKTFANSEVINDRNGILIKDSAEDFCDALNLCWEKRLEINYEDVAQSLKEYSWVIIVRDVLHPILCNL